MIRIDELIQNLPAQRWSGASDRAVRGFTLLDQATIDEDPPAFVLALVDVELDGGDHQLYHLPLLVEADGTATDAFHDVARFSVVGELMGHGATFDGTRGTFHFAGPGLDPLAPPGAGAARAISAEQSNTSVVLDDRVILKLFRRVQRGPNPDLELSRLLTNEGFENIPAHVGEISYQPEDAGEDAAIDLGVAQQFLPDSEEGWTYVLRELHRLYDEIDPADVPEDRELLTAERTAQLLGRIEELGDVTASLHVALAREEGDPAFAPEPLDQSDLKELAEGIRASLASLGGSGLQDLGPLTESIEKRLEACTALDDPGLRIRVHNDYHLGQVLLAARGWMILDFEGEPIRTLEERRAKQSPLKDVAGMLRSFNYAAMAALFERTEPGSEEWQRLEPWAETWNDLARARFLATYLAHAHTEGRFLPVERDDVETLLDVFEIDKVVYELAYEKAHRPAWLRIPLKGIARVAQRDLP